MQDAADGMNEASSGKILAASPQDHHLMNLMPSATMRHWDANRLGTFEPTVVPPLLRALSQRPDTPTKNARLERTGQKGLGTSLWPFGGAANDHTLRTMPSGPQPQDYGLGTKRYAQI
eukprot:scaffold319136_cov21-Tisochrysis_lutea.AAC.1